MPVRRVNAARRRNASNSADTPSCSN
jgi:hypothetical protein